MSYLNLSISKLMKPILGENTLSLFFLIVPRSFKYFVKIIRGWLGISVFLFLIINPHCPLPKGL